MTGVRAGPHAHERTHIITTMVRQASEALQDTKAALET
jgi:hypothetical protein